MSSPKLFLYNMPGSPFAQIVRIALREKGLDFTVHSPEDLMKASPTGAFATANPKAEVPTLIDGDLSLFESHLIVEYIEDKWPSPPLLPKDPAAKAAARLTADVCRNQYEAINWTIMELRVFKRAEGELAENIEKNAKQATQILQDWLAKRLGSSPYFSGSEFGYADIFVAPVLNRSVMNGMGPAEGSSLDKWLARIKERPSVKNTFDEALAGVQGLAKLGGIFKQKGQERRREYRDHRLDFMIRAGGINIVLEGLEQENIRFSWPHVGE